MNKMLSLLLLNALIFVPLAKGAESDFDPYELKVGYFQDATIKDGLIFGDRKGNTYKIVNSQYAKGVLIMKDASWIKHGIYYLFMNGKPSSMTTYYYGKKHGAYEGYHPSGNVQFQYTYSTDLKEGKWYQYSTNGKLFEECEYKNNEKDGLQITYNDSGGKQFVSTFINGKRHGETLQYDARGKVVAKTQYDMGKKVGKTEWFN